MVVLQSLTSTGKIKAWLKFGDPAARCDACMVIVFHAGCRIFFIMIYLKMKKKEK